MLNSMNHLRCAAWAVCAGVLALNAAGMCAAPPSSPPVAAPTAAPTAAPPAVKPAAPAATPAAKPAAAPPMPPATLGHVQEHGTGPITMILIPGLSCDWRVYETFMNRNASKYHMLAVTLPGFGGSNPPELPAGASPMDQKWMRNAEAAIVKYVKDHKLDKPVVVGHSLGGHLATQLAIDHGDLFKSAISLDGLPLFPPPQPGQPDTPEARADMVKQFSAMMQGMPADKWPDGQRRSLTMLVTDPARAMALGEMCAAVPKDTTVEYMLELIGSDLRPQMGKVQIPLLTISAISDEAGLEMAEGIKTAVRDEFKHASPSVKLATIEDSRHFVMDDHPAEVDKMIATFLAGGKVEDVKIAKPAPTPPAPAAGESHRQ